MAKRGLSHTSHKILLAAFTMVQLLHCHSVMVAGGHSSTLELMDSKRGRSHSSHSTSWMELTLVQ